MPQVKLLTELLRTISRSGIAEEGLVELQELLEKISHTKDHVHIEANYDGREWHWKVSQSNVQASQWMPAGTLCHGSDHKTS